MFSGLSNHESYSYIPTLTSDPSSMAPVVLPIERRTSYYVTLSSSNKLASGYVILAIFSYAEFWNKVKFSDKVLFKTDIQQILNKSSQLLLISSSVSANTDPIIPTLLDY